MRNRIYLSLFFLCCIFSQGISFLSEENNEKLANPRIRKKRVLDKTPGGDQPVPLERVPYLVSIIKDNKHQCGGSILSPNFVITAAHCIVMHAEYHVLSGSAYENQGRRHIITGIIFYPGYSPTNLAIHDFVLLAIYPFINFEHSPNKPIKLVNRELTLDTVGTVSGWGSNKEPPNIGLPGSIRSITLPLVARVMCQQYYPSVVIDEKKICAFDLCDQKFCGVGDSGNPFVVDGYLAGVYSLSGRNIKAPAVFTNLHDREYNVWIHAQIAHYLPNEHIPHVPLNMNGGNQQPQHHTANLHNYHSHIH